MFRIVLLVVILIVVSSTAPAHAAVVERFGSDPFSGASPFFVEGEASPRFTFLTSEPPHFQGDRRGTLRVLYDTTLPTARMSRPLGEILALDEDLSFGAILTIRSHGFAADPMGFSQIAFGLWNARTTGLGRTLFPSDSFDLLEVDYFANVTEFGGPFLSPSVFGGNVGGNAFFNFAFRSQEVALPFDVPLLVQGRFDAATGMLQVSVRRHAGGPRFEGVPGGEVTVDLSTVRPAALVDVLGIAAYGEGWPSLRAEVDYDLLFFGPVPPPFGAGALARPTVIVPGSFPAFPVPAGPVGQP